MPTMVVRPTSELMTSFRGDVWQPRSRSAVLPTPEVHGHQDAGDERNAHAVQDVEAEERALADEATAQQGESRVGPRVDHLHVP
jgi:hypothetical protein